MIYNHPIGKDYKWYISGIYCQLGDDISPSYLPRLINIYPQVIVIRLPSFGQIFEQRVLQLFVAGHGSREDDQGQKHFETSGGESWQEPMVDPDPQFFLGGISIFKQIAT